MPEYVGVYEDRWYLHSFLFREVIMKRLELCKCPVCKKTVERLAMLETTDRHGLPVRSVCMECFPKVMAKGYDSAVILHEVEDDPVSMLGWGF